MVRAVEEEVEREDANGTEDVPNSEKSMFSSQSILDITDDSDKTPSWEICYTCKKVNYVSIINLLCKESNTLSYCVLTNWLFRGLLLLNSIVGANGENKSIRD